MSATELNCCLWFHFDLGTNVTGKNELEKQYDGTFYLILISLERVVFQITLFGSLSYSSWAFGKVSYLMFKCCTHNDNDLNL